MPRVSAWPTRAGLTLAAVGAIGVVATPASAAVNGVVAVTSSTVIEYSAATGRANNVVLTRSGTTITVDDTTSVKAGSGCAAVAGDKTKVRCTPKNKKAPTLVRVLLRDGNDSLINKSGLAMAVNGGSGNDRITGGPRADYIDGGLGADALWGVGGGDRLLGDSGNDALSGGDGNDTLSGGEQNDRLLGGNGMDRLSGDAGNDLENGGAGDDVFEQIVEESPKVTDADRFLGGAGRDEMLYIGRSRGIVADADGATGDDGYPGEHDSIGADIEAIWGGNGNDRLLGTGRADFLSGMSGNDTLLGYGGNDTLFGDTGADLISGGAGDDSLYASDGSKDRVDGGANATATGDTCQLDKLDISASCERKQ
ncbi:calcium-binding protein [Paractinoplanes atraurantiacus]|uniref:Hemolysin-type calcium-binding repeat-containing protein n=1 Tax=Paractinoplanes atraurantiacus TaxID=1036182 RepID=A0A285EZA5_9ACTN|nr:calcium-binding protein [Actinoplanes atraurantiacus]SNY04133.1 Hemolysin-type calcium-binding repeat-containing protein [Actinoplanes atraurantiacus]